jgi:O-antigen/teichoic acid export membrane protein
MFLGMQLRNVQVVDVNDEYPFQAYLFTRLFYVISAIIVLIILSLFLFASYIEFAVFYLIVLLKSQEQFIDIIYGYYQKKLRVDIMGKSILIRSIIDIPVFLLLIYSDKLLLFCFAVSNLVHLCTYLFFDKRCLKTDFNIKIETPHLRNLMPIVSMYIFPLTKKTYLLSISTLLSSLTTNIPRYFIKYLIGYSFLGIYGGISYLSIACFTLFQPMQILLRPRLAMSYVKDKNKFNSLKRYGYFMYIAFGITGIIGIICLGPFLLKLFFTPEFSKYSLLLLYLFISSLFSSMGAISSLSLQAKQIFNQQVYVSAITIVVCAISSWVLIYAYGITGIYFSTLITGLTTFFAYFYLDKKYE